MENYLTTSSVPAFPAPVVPSMGVAHKRDLGVGSCAAGFTGDASNLTDDVVPGLRVWSPPA